MAPEAPRGLKICIQAPQGILRRTPERFCPKTLLKNFYGALKMGHVEEKCQFWLFWLFFTIWADSKAAVGPPFELLTQFFLHFPMCYNKLGKVSEKHRHLYIYFFSVPGDLNPGGWIPPPPWLIGLTSISLYSVDTTLLTLSLYSLYGDKPPNSIFTQWILTKLGT